MAVTAKLHEGDSSALEKGEVEAELTRLDRAHDLIAVSTESKSR